MSDKKYNMSRIDNRLKQELDDINDKRKSSDKDLKKISMREFTGLFIKHQAWRKIKQDTINFIFPKDKKGMSLIGLFLGLAVVFLIVLFLGLGVFLYHSITTNLMVDVQVGNVNLLNATNQTMGQIDRGLYNNADNLGIAVILGMIFFMVMNGYFVGRKFHRLFIIVDIFILVFAFIFAVYLSMLYNSIIYASSVLSVYVDYMPKTSQFMLHLPWYVSIIGILIMIVSYLIIPKSENENIQTGSNQVYGY